jgi:hypothetical protein
MTPHSSRLARAVRAGRRRFKLIAPPITYVSARELLSRLRVRSAPSDDAVGEPAALSPAERRPATVEVPYTRAVRQLVAAERPRRIWTIAAACGGAFIAFAAIVPEDSRFPAIYAGVGALLLAVVLVEVLWSARDLRAPTYWRTTGPIEHKVIRARRARAEYLQLFDRKIGGPNLPEVNLDWGTVDHTKHSRIILSIRDSADRLVYVLPGYQQALASEPDTETGGPVQAKDSGSAALVRGDEDSQGATAAGQRHR